MQKSLIQSIAFHLVVIAILLLSSWDIFSRDDDRAEPIPITVELLPIAEKTNIPQKPKTPPKPKPKTEKVQPKPVAKPKPKEPEKPKPEPKKPEKPKEKPKPVEKKQETSELDSLLKTLEEVEAEEQKTSSEAPFDDTQKLSISEIDYIRNLIMRQFIPCWNVPAGARNAAGLRVKLHVDIEQNGVAKFVGFAEEGKYGSDDFYRVAAESARRAVLDPRCNPLREMPPMDKYEQWRELTLIFDPQDLIY